MVDEEKKPKRNRPKISHEPLEVPFVILVDGREKAPYTFDGLLANAALQCRPLIVRTEWAHLKTGDYSIKGLEDHVAIERKSLADLFGTIGKHHDRFKAEHERLSAMDFGAVVVEASWIDILERPPERSRLKPKTVFRTCCAWTIRYHVPWFTAENRRLGEVTTFRLLERWWLDFQERVGPKSDTCRICGRPLESHRSWKRGLGPTCAAKGDRLLALEVERGAHVVSPGRNQDGGERPLA